MQEPIDLSKDPTQPRNGTEAPIENDEGVAVSHQLADCFSWRGGDDAKESFLIPKARGIAMRGLQHHRHIMNIPEIFVHAANRTPAANAGEKRPGVIGVATGERVPSGGFLGRSDHARRSLPIQASSLRPGKRPQWRRERLQVRACALRVSCMHCVGRTACSSRNMILSVGEVFVIDGLHNDS
jgi:hypothetical protein